MPDRTERPRLTLGHVTLAVHDLDAMVAFYTEVLGFEVTNRGTAGDSEMAFISQDPTAHHQIVLVSGLEVGAKQFVLADHLAFRTGDIDDLRTIRDSLVEAGVDDLLPVTHGNTWSLYFTDPEGNGLECFVDTPFHVAQPFLGEVDLDRADADIEVATRAAIECEPEFQPFDEWREDFVARLSATSA